MNDIPEAAIGTTLTNKQEDYRKNLYREWLNKEIKMSQQEAAKKMGFSSQSSFANYLRGITPLSKHVALKIEAAVPGIKAKRIMPDAFTEVDADAEFLSSPHLTKAKNFRAAFVQLLTSFENTPIQNRICDILDGLEQYSGRKIDILTRSNLISTLGKYECAIESHLTTPQREEKF